MGGQWREWVLWVEGVGVEGLAWEMGGWMGGCVCRKYKKERTILLINIFLYFIPSQVSNPQKIP